MMLWLGNIVGQVLDNMASRSFRQFSRAGIVGNGERAGSPFKRSEKGERSERPTGVTKWSPLRNGGSGCS